MIIWMQQHLRKTFICIGIFSNRCFSYQSFILFSTPPSVVSKVTGIAVSARCCWTRLFCMFSQTLPITSGQHTAECKVVFCRFINTCITILWLFNFTFGIFAALFFKSFVFREYVHSGKQNQK